MFGKLSFCFAYDSLQFRSSYAGKFLQSVVCNLKICMMQWKQGQKFYRIGSLKYDLVIREAKKNPYFNLQILKSVLKVLFPLLLIGIYNTVPLVSIAPYPRHILLSSLVDSPHPLGYLFFLLTFKGWALSELDPEPFPVVYFLLGNSSLSVALYAS